jgi:hypothetical protein
VAFGSSAGQAIWNGAGSTFGTRQGAQLTFANATLNNTALILKATGGTAAAPANFIRVQYQTGGGGRVVVSTTNGGVATVRATIASGAFVNGSKFGAVVEANGLVSVYRTVGTTTTVVGTVQIQTTGTGSFPLATGGGRIGFQVPEGARVDNFSGWTLP